VWKLFPGTNLPVTRVAFAHTSGAGLNSGYGKDTSSAMTPTTRCGRLVPATSRSRLARDVGRPAKRTFASFAEQREIRGRVEALIAVEQSSRRA
jgi:hypothetical protein